MVRTTWVDHVNPAVTVTLNSAVLRDGFIKCQVWLCRGQVSLVGTLQLSRSEGGQESSIFGELYVQSQVQNV